MTIEERYEWACNTPSDIAALIPVLRKYGERCQHITEMGVRTGVSTSAWLAAKPKTLVCYDIERTPAVGEIHAIAFENGIDFEFYQENTANSFIEDTDLLFIDTVHNSYQLFCELDQNHEKVRRFIILHDTDTFGVVGDGGPGLWNSLGPFLADRKVWKILEHRPESNGLTVLQRI